MLRQTVMLITVILLSSLLLFSTAEAKRFGGGSSFGYRRNVASAPMFQRPQQNNRPSFLGSLMRGLAIGAILSYLFMGHGHIGFILLLLGGVWLVAKIFRSRQAMSQMANPSSYRATSSSSAGYSADLHDEAFLNEAKSLFLRLQAANDAKNLNDIRQFTTPEVFAEIVTQLQARGDTPNQTDVIRLEASILAIDAHFASVNFSGVLREEPTLPPENFSETWHFQRTPQGTWLVAGLEQN